jgi:uncharacterized protein (DUF427 family)
MLGMAVRMKHHLGQSTGELRYEPTPARVRAWVSGELALDTTSAVLVWEPRRIVPVYAVPVADLRGSLRETEPPPPAPDPDSSPPMLGPDSFAPHFTPGTVVDVQVGGSDLPGAGFVADDPDLDGLVVLDFPAFGPWRVEDEELVGHPRDPFKRIDVLATTRQVEVRLDGQLLAASGRPLVLLETHLPVRWYLPPDDVRLDLLEPSETRSTCAYKGHASYLSLADGSPAGRDIAWRYESPLDDALRVKDHVCFWSERTDITVDGEQVRRPVTPWSTPEEQAGADSSRLEFG